MAAAPISIATVRRVMVRGGAWEPVFGGNQAIVRNRSAVTNYEGTG